MNYDELLAPAAKAMRPHVGPFDLLVKHLVRLIVSQRMRRTIFAGNAFD